MDLAIFCNILIYKGFPEPEDARKRLAGLK